MAMMKISASGWVSLFLSPYLYLQVTSPSPHPVVTFLASPLSSALLIFSLRFLPVHFPGFPFPSPLPPLVLPLFRFYCLGSLFADDQYTVLPAGGLLLQKRLMYSLQYIVRCTLGCYLRCHFECLLRCLLGYVLLCTLESSPTSLWMCLAKSI